MNLFIEGITDYLTYTVLEDSLEYDLTHKNEICCLAWLMSVYGTDIITEKICCGEILDFIDEKSEIGNGSKIHECLATIDQSTDQQAVKEAVWTEMGILTEVSKNSPEPDLTWKLLEQFRQSYAPYLT